MKSLERVSAALEFRVTDRVPLFLQIGGFAATATGIQLRDYLHDSRLLAEAQFLANEQFPNDILLCFLDFCVEAEALGAKIGFADNAYPHVLHPVLEDWREIKSFKVPDPYANGRMPIVLDACRNMVHKDKGEHFIMGQCLGPTTIAAQIFGIENLIYLVADEPEGFITLLNFTVKVTYAFVEAVFDAGAHGVMVSDPSASPNVFPPGVFAKFIQPILKDLFAALKKPKRVNWLQITGNTKAILPMMTDLAIDVITIDSPVELSGVPSDFSHIAVGGNFNPMQFLNGSYEDIAASLEQALNGGRRTGYILASGCEIPLDAETKKVKYLIKLLEYMNR